MRDILFSAKRIDNGCWVSGYHIKDGVTGKHFIVAEGSLLHESDKVGEEGLLNFVAFEVDEDTISVNMDSEWTSVEERLPKAGEHVLVSFRSAGFLPATAIISENGRWSMLQGAKGFNDVTEDVIAWRTLPGPYRKEG